MWVPKDQYILPIVDPITRSTPLSASRISTTLTRVTLPRSKAILGTTLIMLGIKKWIMKPMDSLNKIKETITRMFFKHNPVPVTTSMSSRTFTKRQLTMTRFHVRLNSKLAKSSRILQKTWIPRPMCLMLHSICLLILLWKNSKCNCKNLSCTREY